MTFVFICFAILNRFNDNDTIIHSCSTSCACILQIALFDLACASERNPAKRAENGENIDFPKVPRRLQLLFNYPSIFVYFAPS